MVKFARRNSNRFLLKDRERRYRESGDELLIGPLYSNANETIFSRRSLLIWFESYGHDFIISGQGQVEGLPKWAIA